MENNDDPNGPLVEGRQIINDISIQWVEGFDDIKQLEKGIPVLEFCEKKNTRNIEMEFRLLRRITESQHHNENLREYNPKINNMNRYNNIIPYKHTEVKLTDQSYDPEESDTYINANYITSCMGDQQQLYIATQGPLPSTFKNFWNMVWNENVQVIMMLCNLKENDKPQCNQYWPDKGDKMELQNFTVICNEEEEQDNQIIKRSLQLKNSNDENTIKTVYQYQWIGWPDHGVPHDNDHGVIQNIVDIMLQESDKQNKSVIHCSAGVGRTGTIISLTNLMLTLNYYQNKLQAEEDKEKQKNYKLSIFAVVRRLREQRWGMVHTSEQYGFLYNYLDKIIKETFPEKIIQNGELKN